MIQKIADLLAWLIGFLPSDPILSELEEHVEVLSEYMSYINYFIPFNGIFKLLEKWAAGLVLYYVFVTNKELIMKMINHLLDSVRGVLNKLFNVGGGSE